MKQHPAQLLGDLGEFLRATRKKRSIPLRLVSSRSGVPISTITRIERGEPSVPLTSIIRLAHALKLDQQEISTSLGLRVIQPYLPLPQRLGLGYENTQVVFNPAIVDIDNFLVERRNILAKGGVPILPGLEDHEILLLATLDQNIVEVPGVAQAVIWDAVESGLAVTLEDANLFVADLRRTRGMSLEAFGKEVGIVTSFLYRLERQRVENVHLIDVLRIETRFPQEGRIFTTYWAGGMFELWCHDAHVFTFRPSLDKLTGQEVDIAKAYVRLMRTRRIFNILREKDPVRLWSSVAPKYPILSANYKANDSPQK